MWPMWFRQSGDIINRENVQRKIVVPANVAGRCIEKCS